MQTKRSEAGMATLEMAIVLPLLLLVVFAIVEFGLAFARLQIVQNAAREAARTAVLYRPNCSDGQVVSEVNATVQMFSGNLGMGTLPNPTLTPPGGLCSANIIQVSLTFNHDIPVAGGLISFITGGERKVFIPLPGTSAAQKQQTLTGT